MTFLHFLIYNLSDESFFICIFLFSPSPCRRPTNGGTTQKNGAVMRLYYIPKGASPMKNEFLFYFWEKDAPKKPQKAPEKNAERALVSEKNHTEREKTEKTAAI